MLDLSQETEALARRLAAAQSVTVDTAVRQALEARSQAAGIAPEPPRDRSPEAVSTRRARMDRLAREIAALPILDPRSPGEIVNDLDGA
jgi:antitoxin VapB